jgi:hypothetical protein
MSKGKTIQMTFSGDVKLSYKFQSAGVNFGITKSFDPDDDTIDWNKEKELLKEEVAQVLEKEVPENIELLKELATVLR